MSDRDYIGLKYALDGTIKLTAVASSIVPSTTFTRTVPDAVFPAASENVYVTVVCPTAKKSPGAAVRLIRKAVPELSVAVGSVKLTSIPGVPSSTWRVILLLVTVTTGAVVSTIDDSE